MNNRNPRKFERYSRGQIVMVDFSPSMGGEFRGKHLAVVLTKKDSPNNSVLTVIPLSSKEKPYYLPLGTFISKQVPKIIKTSLNDIKEGLKSPLISDIHQIELNVKELSQVLSTYKKMNKSSFALVENITTISKLRVLKPINKHDPIRQIKLPNNLLDELDKKLIEVFTK